MCSHDCVHQSGGYSAGLNCLKSLRILMEFSCSNLPFEDAADVDEHNRTNNQSVKPEDFQTAYFPDWLIPPHLHPMSEAGPARGWEPWKNIWHWTRELRNPDAYFEEVPADWVPPPPVSKNKRETQ